MVRDALIFQPGFRSDSHKVSFHDALHTDQFEFLHVVKLHASICIQREYLISCGAQSIVSSTIRSQVHFGLAPHQLDQLAHLQGEENVVSATYYSIAYSLD